MSTRVASAQDGAHVGSLEGPQVLGPAGPQGRDPQPRGQCTLPAPPHQHGGEPVRRHGQRPARGEREESEGGEGPAAQALPHEGEEGAAPGQPHPRPRPGGPGQPAGRLLPRRRPRGLLGEPALRHHADLAHPPGRQAVLQGKLEVLRPGSAEPDLEEALAGLLQPEHHLAPRHAEPPGDLLLPEAGAQPGDEPVVELGAPEDQAGAVEGRAAGCQHLPEILTNVRKGGNAPSPPRGNSGRSAPSRPSPRRRSPSRSWGPPRAPGRAPWAPSSPGRGSPGGRPRR